MNIRRAIVAMVLLSASGLAAAQQSDEPQGERPALEPFEVLDVITDVTYFNGTWVRANFGLDRLDYFDSRGNVLGSFPLNLGVFNLYGTAGKLYFDAVDSSNTFRVGYVSKDFMVNGMVVPPGFNPGGVAVFPDDTGVFISKSPTPSAFWFTKNYAFQSPPITIPGRPSVIDICPGGNWCIGTQTGLLVLDRSWNINPVPGITANLSAVRYCGSVLWMGGNGFVNYTLNPGADYHLWQFNGFTVPFQVNDFACGQNGTVVGAGSNGGAFYADPFNNVTRTFQLSPTSNFIRVSLGPGRFPNGYFLNSQGSLLYSVPASDLQYPADRNSTSSRLISTSLRHLF